MWELLGAEIEAVVLQMGGLLDTMSTETGERAAQAAQKTALETVIEDTEAELAKLQRSKVASMIKLYQGQPSASCILSFHCVLSDSCTPTPHTSVTG